MCGIRLTLACASGRALPVAAAFHVGVVGLALVGAFGTAVMQFARRTVGLGVETIAFVGVASAALDAACSMVEAHTFTSFRTWARLTAVAEFVLGFASTLPIAVDTFATLPVCGTAADKAVGVLWAFLLAVDSGEVCFAVIAMLP